RSSERIRSKPPASSQRASIVMRGIRFLGFRETLTGCCYSRLLRKSSCARLADLVEPHDAGVVSGVAERLELVIPRGTQRHVQLALQFDHAARRDLHRVAYAVLADDDVACAVGLGVMDAEIGRVQPAAAVVARRR